MEFIMEILSRLVSKQVNYIWSIMLFAGQSVVYAYLIIDFMSCTDMEIPKVMGRILEVCTLNKASVFQCVAAGEILFAIIIYDFFFSLENFHLWNFGTDTNHYLFFSDFLAILYTEELSVFELVLIFQLPPAQLENALNRTAALKAPLVAHAIQPNIRSSLPKLVQKSVFVMVEKILSLTSWPNSLLIFYWIGCPVLGLYW